MTGALPTPAAVMIWLDEQAVALDDLGKQLENAHIALGDAEVAWDEARDIALGELADDYQERGERLPGEDVRLAMARRRVDFEVYATYRKAAALVKAIEGRVRRVEAAVNARQSTLKGLREGAATPNYDTQTGEVIGGRR